MIFNRSLVSVFISLLFIIAVLGISNIHAQVEIGEPVMHKDVLVDHEYIWELIKYDRTTIYKGEDYNPDSFGIYQLLRMIAFGGYPIHFEDFKQDMEDQFGSIPPDKLGSQIIIKILNENAKSEEVDFNNPFQGMELTYNGVILNTTIVNPFITEIKVILRNLNDFMIFRNVQHYSTNTSSNIFDNLLENEGLRDPEIVLSESLGTEFNGTSEFLNQGYTSDFGDTIFQTNWYQCTNDDISQCNQISLFEKAIASKYRYDYTTGILKEFTQQVDLIIGISNDGETLDMTYDAQLRIISENWSFPDNEKEEGIIFDTNLLIPLAGLTVVAIIVFVILKKKNLL